MLDNQTLRQTVEVTRAGDQIRLRLTNEYGDTLFLIGAAAVARSDDQEAARPVMFGGKPSITIPAGSPWLSDPVTLRVRASDLITVSLFSPRPTWLTNAHRDPLNFTLISPPGDHARATSFASIAELGRRPFLSGIEVLAAGPPATVVACPP